MSLDKKEVFVGTVMEVHEWAKNNRDLVHHVGGTNRTFETEEEVYEKWKNGILKDAELL